MWKITDRFDADTAMITPVGTVHWNTLFTDDEKVADYFSRHGMKVNGQPRFMVEQMPVEDNPSSDESEEDPDAGENKDGE